jgi:hypothetical protein
VEVKRQLAHVVEELLTVGRRDLLGWTGEAPVPTLPQHNRTPRTGSFGGGWE